MVPLLCETIIFMKKKTLLGGLIAAAFVVGGYSYDTYTNVYVPFRDNFNRMMKVAAKERKNIPSPIILFDSPENLGVDSLMGTQVADVVFTQVKLPVRVGNIHIQNDTTYISTTSIDDAHVCVDLVAVDNRWVKGRLTHPVVSYDLVTQQPAPMAMR